LAGIEEIDRRGRRRERRSWRRFREPLVDSFGQIVEDDEAERTVAVARLGVAGVERPTARRWRWRSVERNLLCLLAEEEMREQVDWWLRGGVASASRDKAEREERDGRGGWSGEDHGTLSAHAPIVRKDDNGDGGVPLRRGQRSWAGLGRKKGEGVGRRRLVSGRTRKEKGRGKRARERGKHGRARGFLFIYFYLNLLKSTPF
jgi:hypothetical protein